jgi:hypothetical protein
MKCSVCSSEINEKYCSKCGQYYKGGRINSITFLGDLFDSVFSLEKSFFRNIRIGLSQPKTLVLNYWNGFRKFYYSPGKFFTIASLFLVLHYSIANDFLGIVVTGNISSQFVILLTNILLLTFSSFLLYIQFKKNFFEHLILNIYNVSLWIIIFFPISVILSLTVNNTTIEKYFYIPYHILIIIWNSKAFELTKPKRFLFVTINLLMFYGTLLFLVYMFGEF